MYDALDTIYDFQATWLKEKTAELEEIAPMTDQEFLDEVHSDRSVLRFFWRKSCEEFCCQVEELAWGCCLQFSRHEQNIQQCNQFVINSMVEKKEKKENK